MARILLLAFAGILTVFAGGNTLAKPSSAYTKLDLDKCRIIARYEAGATWQCGGYNRIPVFVSEGDLRMSVHFGAAGRNGDYWQSFTAFNRVHHTLEWRVDQQAGGVNIPYATILRWFVSRIDGNGPERQVLVVSRLEGSHSCHIAYIDANANKNANELARRAADQFARTFRCSSDRPRWVGKVSRNAPRPSG